MKYENKKYLKQKYLDEKLSACQIAELCSCGRETILRRLKKFNIPIRNPREYQHLRCTISIGNDNYCNKEWLQKKYLIEMLSTRQIARLCNCGKTAINNWIKKHNIPIRSMAEGNHLSKTNHCNLTKEAKQWIDGELLGDGCLYPSSNYCVGFCSSSKYKEYAQYVSDTLNSFGIKQCGKIIEQYYKEMDCYDYKYTSLTYPELMPIRKRWYPNGKKIIPKDLKLTPLVLRQELIGDGCLHIQTVARPYITLSTCGFPIKDVDWLVKELNKSGFKATRRPSDNTIHISSYSTKEFLNYIGKCPVQCYDYKWSYS